MKDLFKERAKKIYLWLRRLQVMTFKELKQLLRDTPLLLFMIYAFTIEIYLAGSGAALELNNASVFVHDADRSPESRELIYRFQPPYFNVTGEVAGPEEGVSSLDSGKALAFIDIPEHFSRKLLREEQASVQLLVDTSNTTIGYLASSYSLRIGAVFAGEIAGRNLSGRGLEADSMPDIENQRRIFFNPALDHSWFNAISELLTMMTAVSVLLPGAALVREKERGTIEQLFVSPLTPFQVMFPKVVAMTMVIVAGSAVSLFGVMQPFFSVPIRGSLLLFFSLTAMYAFTTSGLGLLAATYARNQAQVGMLTILLVAPMIMLSGTWTPLEAMPGWLQYLIYISPLHHFMIAAYGILLRGAGLDILWDSVIAMAALGGAMFLLGIRRFRKQFG